MCPHGDRRLPACSLRPSHDADRQLAQLERQDERLLGEERLIKRLMETPGQRHRRRTEKAQPDEGAKYISGSGGRLALLLEAVVVPARHAVCLLEHKAALVRILAPAGLTLTPPTRCTGQARFGVAQMAREVAVARKRAALPQQETLRLDCRLGPVWLWGRPRTRLETGDAKPLRHLVGVGARRVNACSVGHIGRCLQTASRAGETKGDALLEAQVQVAAPSLMPRHVVRVRLAVLHVSEYERQPVGLSRRCIYMSAAGKLRAPLESHVTTGSVNWSVKRIRGAHYKKRVG